MLLPPASESGLISNIMLADMDGLGVAANSTESELAKEFVAMVSREDIQASDWYLQSAGVSPRADVPFPAAIDSMKSEQLKSADSLGTSGQLTVAVPYHADIPRLLSRMLAGELTEEEVAVRLEDLVQVERSG
jgi:ABC-type glycerol-3-phosphate transport system substrate-binding protein